jgi:hypothetical protein
VRPKAARLRMHWLSSPLMRSTGTPAALSTPPRYSMWASHLPRHQGPGVVARPGTRGGGTTRPQRECDADPQQRTRRHHHHTRRHTRAMCRATRQTRQTRHTRHTRHACHTRHAWHFPRTFAARVAFPTHCV